MYPAAAAGQIVFDSDMTSPHLSKFLLFEGIYKEIRGNCKSEGNGEGNGVPGGFPTLKEH